MVKEAQKSSNTKLEQTLIENFVALQKVMADLAEKTSELNDKISKLLDIFEMSAKSLAEKDIDFDKNNKELNEKLDKILEQNKNFSRSTSETQNRSMR